MNNLNLLNPATPLDGADFYELVEEVRLLKGVLKTVLMVSLNPTGSLRAIGESLLSSNAVGSVAIADDAIIERHYSAMSIPTDAFKTESIPGTALQDNVIIARHFAANSIPTSAFDNNTIPLSALGALITGAYIASHASVDGSRAIATDHIKDGAVIDRCIGSMDFSKLIGGTDGSFLYRTGGFWTGVEATGALTYNAGTNKFDLNSPVATSNFADTKARTSDGGASVAGVWTERTIGEISDEAELMTFVGNVFTLLPGTYYIHIRVPGYNVGDHQARLYRDNGDSTHEIPLWGSSATSAGGVQTDSIIQGFITATEDYSFKVEHWCQSSVATSGLGKASSSDNTEFFANHVEVFTDGYVMRLTDDT